MKRKSFFDYVENRDSSGGIDPFKGLAGEDNDSDFSYSQKQPDYRNGYKPLGYTPVDGEDEPGDVWVARDNDKKKSLADEMSPDMEPEKVTPLGKLAKNMTREVGKAVLPDKLDSIKQKKFELPKMVSNKTVKGKKLTNEEFLNLTGEMTPSELMNFFTEENQLMTISDLFGNEFTPEPNQTISYITSVISNSPRMMDRFIIECKRAGCFKNLIESAMEHGDCYDHVVDVFADSSNGRTKASMLANSMHDKYVSALDAVDFSESVSPSVNDRFGQQQGSGSTNKEFDPYNNKSTNSGNPEFSSKNPETDDSKGYAGGEKQQGQPMDNMGGQTNFGGTSMGTGKPDFGSGPAKMPAMIKKLKAETAAGNLFDASAKFEPLRTLMEGSCKNGKCS